MIDAKGSNIVFLLCVPRSGSSLTTCLLQNHSQVFATQEMWFLMSLYDLRLKQIRPYGGSSILTRFYNSMLTDEMFTRACRSFALQVYHDLMQTSGARFIVDKSPRYYCILEFIDKLFPHSKRIMLTRNPLDIASSYKKLEPSGRTKFDLVQNLYRQELDMRMVDLTVGLLRYIDYSAASSPYVTKIAYERLVANPQEQLTHLLKGLGLEYENGMEHYGRSIDTVKSELYYSMGVGDPSLAQHELPHTKFVEQWPDVLNKREIELLCRALGAGVFHRMGYADQLEHAERITGTRFDAAPDEELLQLRTKQLQEATGCSWEANYEMRLVEDATADDEHDAWDRAIWSADKTSVHEQELMQMRIVLRALDERLQHAYEDRDRYRRQYERLKCQVNKVKSWLPFGNRLANWARVHGDEGGKQS